MSDNNSYENIKASENISYEEMTDHQLVALFKAGDTKVINHICERFKPWVKQKAKSLYLVGGDTEDLIQEGMIGLFSALGDYDLSSEVTFFHFAKICIQRQMYDAIAFSQRKKNAPLNESVSIYDESEDGTGEELFSYDNDPAQMIEKVDSLNTLVLTLKDSLSKMETQVFDLYLKGYDYQEIAKILEKEPKSIDNALSRIHIKGKKIRDSID